MLYLSTGLPVKNEHVFYPVHFYPRTDNRPVIADLSTKKPLNTKI